MIQRVPKNGRDQPNDKVTIVDCGELPMETEAGDAAAEAPVGSAEKEAQQPIKAEL